MDGVTLVTIALRVISDRLITILALLTSFGLGCWTMWDPKWERVTTLAIFVIFSYLLVKVEERKNDERQTTQAQ
jgi:TRAP-type C4-dicarboxylate transport system permease small subunit